MPAITGTAGGRNGTAPRDPQVKFYRDLLTGNVDFAALDNHVRAYPTPVNVSMVVNNACNLQCRHCYLQVPTLADRALSEHEWERIFLSALHSDTTMLSLKRKYSWAPKARPCSPNSPHCVANCIPLNVSA